MHEYHLLGTADFRYPLPAGHWLTIDGKSPALAEAIPFLPYSLRVRRVIPFICDPAAIVLSLAIDYLAGSRSPGLLCSLTVAAPDPAVLL